MAGGWPATVINILFENGQHKSKKSSTVTDPPASPEDSLEFIASSNKCLTSSNKKLLIGTRFEKGQQKKLVAHGTRWTI